MMSENSDEGIEMAPGLTPLGRGGGFPWQKRAPVQRSTRSAMILAVLIS